MYTYHYWGNHTLSGVDNMALEDHFLHEASTKKTAHIRFYDFAKDTVVLGYNQHPSAVTQWANDFSVVRRGSGGSHVHVGDNMLAYSIIVPRDGSFRYHNDFRAYYADKIARAFERCGIPELEVDNKASTIMTSGRVIASHAVVWGVRSALLHGIVIITPYDLNKVMKRIYLGTRQIGNKTYSEASALENIPAAAGLISLKPNAAPEQRARFIKDYLADAMLAEIAGRDFVREELAPAILDCARTYSQSKHAQSRWLLDRNPEHSDQFIEELPQEKLTGPLKQGWGYCLYIQVADKDFKKMADPDKK